MLRREGNSNLLVKSIFSNDLDVKNKTRNKILIYTYVTTIIVTNITNNCYLFRKIYITKTVINVSFCL